MADLFSLPDELLLMILDYCTTMDLVQVSQVCQKLNKITCDRKHVGVLNLNFQTKLQLKPLKTFVSFRPRAENVTTIDLTSCYWLTSSFIHNLISRLLRVENVLVVDTALRPNHLKQLLQTLTQVKRLSWTWHSGMDDEGIDQALLRLEFLFLCLKDTKGVNGLVKWVNKCEELRELWINNIDAHSFVKSSKPIQLEHLESIVLYPCTAWPLIQTEGRLTQIWRSHPAILSLGNQQLLDIKSLFTSHWREITHVIQLGAHNIQRLSCPEQFGPNIGELLSVLNVLKALHVVMPTSLQYQDFLFNSLASNRIHLNELSLDVKNRNQECSMRFCEVAACCTELKYLCVPSQAIVCPTTVSPMGEPQNDAKSESPGPCCSWDHTESSSSWTGPSTSRMRSSLPWMRHSPSWMKHSPLWMKQSFNSFVLYPLGASASRVRVSRISEPSPEVDTPFKRMVRSTPHVEVCEIGVTNMNNSEPTMPIQLEWDFQSLSAISQWENLKSLTLSNLPIKQGKFLSDITRNCKKLKSLKLVDLGPDAACVYAHDLYAALPFAWKLEDFHWTQNYVGDTMKLWLSLQQIPSLRRVALCLQGESSLNEQDVDMTMEKCPSLLFLYVATCSTQVRNRLIKSHLTSRWSPTRPHLCVWFGTPGEFLDAAESSPTVHAGEMLQEFSRIKGLPVSDSHFLSFGKRAWAPQV